MAQLFSEAHVTFCVVQKCFIINTEGKFLTIKRSDDDPSYPGKWDLPGGELKKNETSYEGMLREIAEEISLSTDVVVPFLTHSYFIRNIPYYGVLYRTSTNCNTVVLSFEHSEYKWVTVDEFLSLDRMPWIAETLQEEDAVTLLRKQISNVQPRT